jgi:hypothetical protein
VARGQTHDLIAPAVEKWIACDENPPTRFWMSVAKATRGQQVAIAAAPRSALKRRRLI